MISISATEIAIRMEISDNGRSFPVGKILLAKNNKRLGLVGMRERVEMVLDAEIDAAYPQRWIGKVTVSTVDGRVLHGRIDEPKGDPGNTLSRDEITAKALRLAAFSGGATASEMQTAVNALWGVAGWPRVGRLLEAAV